MEAWLKIFVGLCLLWLSLGYLYRPVWILRLNAIARAVVFNDTYVLLYRRRWGVPLFVAAALFLFTGFGNLSLHEPKSSTELWRAYRSFLAHDYRRTIVQCQAVLAQEPENEQAWSLLGSAWTALGEHDKAARAKDRSRSLKDESARRARPTAVR